MQILVKAPGRQEATKDLSHEQFVLLLVPWNSQELFTFLLLSFIIFQHSETKPHSAQIWFIYR